MHPYMYSAGKLFARTIYIRYKKNFFTRSVKTLTSKSSSPMPTYHHLQGFFVCHIVFTKSSIFFIAICLFQTQLATCKHLHDVDEHLYSDSLAECLHLPNHLDKAYCLQAKGDTLIRIDYGRCLPYYIGALSEFQLATDTEAVVNLSIKVSKVYRLLGKPSEAFDFILKAIDLGYTSTDSVLHYTVQAELADFSHYSGNFQLAYKYSKENLAYLIRVGNKDLQAREYFRQANSLRMQGKYQKALHLYQIARELHVKTKKTKRSNWYTLPELGKTYLAMDSFQKALSIFRSVFSRVMSTDAKTSVRSDAYLNLADCFCKMEMYDSALYYAQPGLDLAVQLGNIHHEKEINRVLSEAYFGMNNIAKAYESHMAFSQLKSITEGKEITSLLLKAAMRWKMEAKNTQLAMLELDAHTAKQDALRHKNWLFTLVFLGIFILATVVLIAFYWGLKNQYSKLKLNNKILLMRMNPHFIGNLLMAVQDSLHTEPLAKVEEYLVRSAAHIRHNLESSYEDWIPLKKELEELERYVQLQQLRFGDRLSYNTKIDPSIYTDTCLIPSFILQPLIENAIEHGRRSSSGAEKWEVMLIFSLRTPATLNCKVINKADAVTNKPQTKRSKWQQKKSLSHKIINERLKLYSKNRQSTRKIQLKKINTDEKTGMTVSLSIPTKTANYMSKVM